MSSYPQDQAVKNLSSLINEIKRKRGSVESFSKSDEDEVRWGTTHFFSKVLATLCVNGWHYSKREFE